ncbi:long-chain fatty acid--CoA ligase [Corynebacterium breve]|uniref:Acyl-CoA synthetase n=1 Tax=Corynebacterium breve TaxID=3049799 RepID=A0ABY8VDC6_9CORY|nr:long-chain fatty acid--CoA ligase [Corynebacterium breve]WIM67102.1 long-chain fatty acid--CoA ligase [Corynebacterium breve]
MSQAFFETPADFTVAPTETCLSALIGLCRANPHLVLFTRPHNYEWVNVTAGEFLDEIYEVAKGLINAGVEPGDRVALLSTPRYEWSLLDYAIWAAGGAVVPIYPSSSGSQVQWIIEDSGAVLAITESREHTDLMTNLVLDDEGSPRIIGSPTKLRRVLELNASAIDTLKFEGRNITDEAVDERIRNVKQDDLGSLVYTSGTTGKPKGCILTHKNWIHQIRGLQTHPIGAIARPGMRMVTYLPMAHVLARAVSLAVTIAGGTQSHWNDPGTLTMELQRTRPHLVLGVPRVFEKVRNAAYNKAADGSAIKAGLFRRAEKVAIEYSKALDTEAGPSRKLEVQRNLFEKLVYSKIKDALGGQVDFCITGGSAMSPELGHFYRGMGVPAYEGYGLTETTAAAAVNFGEETKIGSVGKPVGGYSAMVNDDGEILIKGAGVFTGYLNNDEATKESLVDGWFNTGDLGEIDDNGFITITGRKKDLIVTAGGKNISPQPMEEIIRQAPLISQALVVGDGKPFVGVLVTLDSDELARWKADRNIPENKQVRDLAEDIALRAEVQDAVNMANATVSHAEQIKKFRILDRDLSEEDNELTPTLKVKRNVVFQRFAEDIDKLYKR